AVGEGGRRLRPGAVARRRVVHLERRQTARLPDHLARRRVERAHHLVLVLTTEREDAVADDDRRRVAGADLDLPLAGEVLGPGARLADRGQRAVSVGAAPPRTVEGVLGGDGG